MSIKKGLTAKKNSGKSWSAASQNGIQGFSWWDLKFARIVSSLSKIFWVSPRKSRQKLLWQDSQNRHLFSEQSSYSRELHVDLRPPRKSILLPYRTSGQHHQSQLKLFSAYSLPSISLSHLKTIQYNVSYTLPRSQPKKNIFFVLLLLSLFSFTLRSESVNSDDVWPTEATTAEPLPSKRTNRSLCTRPSILMWRETKECKKNILWFLSYS